MKPLKEKHSGAYMNKVLIDTITDFGIQSHITR